MALSFQQTVHQSDSTSDEGNAPKNAPAFFRIEEKKVHVTATNCNNIVISFKGRTVEIYRPWLDTSVLYYENLTLDGVQAGQWSTWVMDPDNQGVFPLLLTAYVVAKDISVTATKFSKEVKDAFEKLNSSPGSKVDHIITLCLIYSSVSIQLV